MIYRDSIQVLVLVTLLFYFYTHFQLQSAKEISKGKLLLTGQFLDLSVYSKNLEQEKFGLKSGCSLGAHSVDYCMESHGYFGDYLVSSI